MLVTLDGSGPLYLQLYRSLRAAILSRTRPPGARLPSTRALAAELRVARVTVMLCFEQLLAEGYVVSRKGSGTYVATELPDDLAFGVRRQQLAGTRANAAPRLSSYGRRSMAGRHSVPNWEPRRTLLYDFHYGRPAFTDFPHATWRRLLARRARTASARDHDYGPPAGSSALREAIADYVQRARGVVCTPAQVVVVNGSQQGLDLTARVLVDAGDRVVLEEPHYFGARHVFAAAGAQLVAVPVDADGLDISKVREGSRARLAYVTPSHQFPAGAVMPLARRLALLEWARRTGAYVLEDDYDSEYRYAGRPVESLQGLDRAGRVIYAGTFSKLLFPALRLGYLILPEPLVRPFLMAKALANLSGATLEQLALADFIREGHFERHVRRSRARNAARRAALLEAVGEHLGDRVDISGASAGVHVLLWPRGRRLGPVETLIARAADRGVGVYSIAPFYLRRPQRAGLLLGYASLSEDEVRAGIRRLAVAWHCGPAARR